MSRKSKMKKQARKLISLGLGLMLTLNVFSSVASAAVTPLPSPSTPLIWDDFSGGGQFNLAWMNWYNQDGGTGTFSKTTVDSRDVGLFAQTPASSSSWAKFQPWNEHVDLSGYQYVNLTLKNPGYTDEKIKFVANDGAHSFNLTGGWVSVAGTWTDLQFDLDALSPAIEKDSVIFELWLRQGSGTYGEVLVDEITASNVASGTAPTLTGNTMTANSSSTYTQNTTFTFSTTYTDADNEAPFATQLIIDDTAYDMDEVDPLDTTYTDGKDYTYVTKLPAGSHSYYFRTTDTTSNMVTTTAVSGPVVTQSTQIIDVVVSQAGYSANDFKNAQVTSTEPLTDLSFNVLSGSTVVSSGTLVDKGVTWDKHVYSADFSTVTATGSNYKIQSNGISSYPFQIATNIWDNYKDEMTAFYRIQRASVDTVDAYPAGYSTVEPSSSVFHQAGHLDDAASEDHTVQYDLTGGWYDAGDYGKYGGNQWVGAEIALAYVRYAGEDAVAYDNDNNGIPDLIDEAIVGSDYVLKFADQLGGAMYDLRNNSGGFKHPEKSTDNIPGTSDDRVISNPGIGGSAKSAGTLAATARAINAAIAEGDIDSSKVAELAALSADYEDGAVVFHNYVNAHLSDPQGSYNTRGEISNSMLLADVELYLLTNDAAYKTAAEDKISVLSFGNISNTNYWDMRPMSLAEFYPVASTSLQPQIQDLLKQQLDFFISSQDDTPYGVLNQFKNFGVNEPHMSYVGDAMRYYELFGDPAALRAVLKGMYWVYGENPWNISWVSGIGTDFVDFLHTRLDEDVNTSRESGVIIPGAMVSGPNMKNTLDPYSDSPWYMDRRLNDDHQQQWRYNEFSISIQAGMLYTVMALAATDSVTSGAGTTPPEMPILSPIIGDYVRGDVTIFADSDTPLSSIEYNSGGYTSMSVSGDAFSGVVDESAAAPLATKRVDVRGTDSSGNMTYSSTHFTIAPELPDPTHPMLYDDFNIGGYWGSTQHTTQEWVSWWTDPNNQGGTADFNSKELVDGRTAGKFTYDPASDSSKAKFQAWDDKFDIRGYKYINFDLKNPGYENMTISAIISDGSHTFSLLNGFATVPTDVWTSYKIDLDSFPYEMEKDSVKLTFYLKGTDGNYGELLMDDITFTNDDVGTAPTLTSGGVNYSSGDTTTDYTFNVTYADVDNEKPFKVELLLDGVVHVMDAVNVTDTDYTDGNVYTYTTKLPQGIHSYYFHTTDNSSNAISTSVVTGPTVSQTTSPPVTAGEIIIDNTDSAYVTKTGTWTSGTNNPGQFIGADYWYDGNTGKGSKTVTYTPDIETAGSYEVYMMWTEQSNHADNVPVDIVYDGGTDTVTIDQKNEGGEWILLDTYDFAAGTSGSITIRTTGTSGHVIADAVRLVPVGTTPDPDPEPEAEPIIIDNTDTAYVTKVGSWASGTNNPGQFLGSDYLYDGNTGKGSKSVTYTPDIEAAGSYEIYMMWTEQSNHADNAPVSIVYDGGTDSMTVDQTADGGVWNLLGTYDFTVGTSGSITIGNTGTTAHVIADAVKLVPVTTVVVPDPVIVDNADVTGVTLTGSWDVGSSQTDRYGDDYLHDNQTGKGSKSVAFAADLEVSGTYNVYAMWADYTNRSTAVPITITYDGGSDVVYVNQSTNGGVWNLLGTYEFDASTGGVVTISNTGTTGYVIADAVKFEYAE
ncbi:glycoside hydrolase family 9 protein [Paenibacillus sp. HB172176]|uniref:golvesin C-terminal-like domain-containing protein n=1 Tax=Paenibacillus sp. HB172176 TaxID=2493690 RepID=UPI00143B73EE|nr:glycoside hydrolase family 9 protein [Paenibacillus sp. HB172176]